MKTILIFFSVIFIYHSAISQVQFSINAGLNLGNIKTTQDGDGLDSKLSPGYLVAGYVHIPVSAKLKMLTGLEYESVHTKMDFSQTDNQGGGFYYKISVNAKQQLNYLNIPLRLMYSPVAKTKGKWEIGGGPFVGIGLSGNAEGTIYEEYSDGINVTKNEETINEKVKFGSADDDHYKRLNFGIGLNIAYLTVSNLRLGAYTNIGLSNIDNDPDSKTKTFSAGVTIGYLFSTK